jgi:hypothetical protein
VQVRPVTARRVLRSEWVKLRSLRSTAWTLLSAVVLMIGIGWLAGWGANDTWSDLSPQEQATFSPVDVTLAGFYLAQLAVSVLGVLLVTGEYATGMVRATFAAVPRRLPVLWAKAVLFAGVTFALMLLAAIAAFFGGQELLGEHGVPLSQAGAIRGIVGVAGYLTVVAVLAVALGFIIRSTAGASPPCAACCSSLRPPGCCYPQAGANSCCPTSPATPAPQSSARSPPRTA